jgi:hypothetical protein
MEIVAALASQYHAALKTLRLAIERCPDGAWADRADGPAACWRVAYHTLYFTHLYLSVDETSFVPWAKHRQQAVDLDAGEGSDYADIPPYTRDQILTYWRDCDAMVDTALRTLDLASPSSGYSWYAVPKLEHQIVNIRHIQHHAAALSTRLRLGSGVRVPWVKMG